MFNEDVKKKLKDELGFNKRKYNQEKRYIEFELCKLLNISKENTNEFLVKLDYKLEQILMFSKVEGLNNVLKNNIEELFEKEVENNDLITTTIKDYVKTKKLALKIACYDGFGAVDKERLIINQFASTYSKYLGSYEEFKYLRDAKAKIIDSFKKIGIDANERDMFNEIKFYYNRYSNEMAGTKFLDDHREENYDLAKTIFGYLNKNRRNFVDVDSILKVDFMEKENEKISNEASIELNEDNEKKSKLNDCEAKKEVSEEQVVVEIKLHERIKKIEEELEIERIMHNQEKEKLIEEIEALTLEKLQNMDYAREQYKKAIETVIKTLNDKNCGAIMDEFYKYSKGYISEINNKALISNLLISLQSLGIRAIERNKLNSEIILEEKSIYNFRFNKSLSSYDKAKGIVKAPAWFYKNEEMIKELIEVKEQ